MSVRVDPSPLISGALVLGNRGLGVLGSDVPSTGDDGPGYIYNDLALPADAGKEVRGLITVAPSGLTSFFAYEDSSFTASGPDGTYTFTYRLFVDGADLGTADGTISIGDGGSVATAAAGSATVSAVGASTAASGAAAAAGAASVSGTGASIAATAATTAEGAATVSGVGEGASPASAEPAAGAATVSAAGASTAATTATAAAGVAVVSGVGDVADDGSAAVAAAGVATVSAAGGSVAATTAVAAAGVATVSASTVDVAYTTAGVLYVPIRMVSALWSASGVGTTGGEVAWLPPARQPLTYTDGRGQTLCDPAWYRFFEYLAEQRLGGKTGPTLNAVVQTVTETQATAAAATATVTDLQQQTAANAESLFVVRQVAKLNLLTGADQIPQVEL